MLYYNETDVSEGIDINKTSLSKEYDNCLYEMAIVKMKDLGYSRMFAKTVMNLNDIAISNNRGVDCH